MAKEDKTVQVDKKDTVRLFVRSTGPKGFRRIGRYFGPEEEAIDVSAEQAAILLEADKAGDLRVMTQEMKDIAEGVSRKAAQRPAPKAEG
jgi:hypothetical protein